MKTEYVFTEGMMRTALAANGYYTLWHEENWVPPESKNPDYAGMSLLEAFKHLLRKKNVA